MLGNVGYFFLAIFAAFAASFSAGTLLKKRTGLARSIQLVAGAVVFVVLLAFWMNTGKDPAQWVSCKLYSSAPACSVPEQDPVTPRASGPVLTFETVDDRGIWRFTAPEDVTIQSGVISFYGMEVDSIHFRGDTIDFTLMALHAISLMQNCKALRDGSARWIRIAIPVGIRTQYVQDSKVKESSGMYNMMMTFMDATNKPRVQGTLDGIDFWELLDKPEDQVSASVQAEQEFISDTNDYCESVVFSG